MTGKPCILYIDDDEGLGRLVERKLGRRGLDYLARAPACEISPVGCLGPAGRGRLRGCGESCCRIVQDVAIRCCEHPARMHDKGLIGHGSEPVSDAWEGQLSCARSERSAIANPAAEMPLHPWHPVSRSASADLEVKPAHDNEV